MRRLKLITKYFVRNALEEGFEGKKSKSWIFITLGIIFIMACISTPFVVTVLAGYDVLASLGQEGYLISYILTSGSMVILFFGIYTVLNVFCFSDDVGAIMPLPFKSSEVVFGKFIALMLQMYMYDLIIVFPLITYGVISKSGIVFYLYLLLVFVFLPVGPMVIGGILSIILMRFSNLSKYKDAFRIVSGVIMLAAIVIFNIFNNQSSKASEESIKATVMQGNNTLMETVNNAFFTANLSSKALLYSSEFKGLEYIIFTVIISICLFALFYIVGGRLYYKSIIGSFETSSKRENIFKEKKADKFIKKNSQVKALILRDLKVMFRTPQFFINCIGMLIYMPAIFGVTLYTIARDIPDIQDKMFSSIDNYGYILAAVFGFSLLTVCGGGAALTALSREGKDFFVSKYIPVAPREHIKSKVILSLSVNEFVALVIIMIMAILKTPIGLLILSSVISILSIGFIGILELYLDYKSPKLEWDSEKDLFKKNFLPVIIMFFAFLLTGIVAALNFIVKNYIVVFIAVSLIMVVLSVLFYSKLLKAADKVYE